MAEQQIEGVAQMPDGGGIVLTVLGGAAALGLAGGALSLGAPLGLAALLWLIGTPVLALVAGAAWLRWQGRRYDRHSTPAVTRVASDGA
ncbi:hypothetical protein PSM7751_01781 [Pseudooceanicola marinus]|uniref:Uncharacterized protein n=1 Tax=Pseudooceanicola marinus TaxID=396013 RepID=A0A1X6Z3C8_9RHOB|nr:hypothetical protein [Pseudooceanicola marinus]PJE32337.1 hypothetical protein CVM50_05340 [Pseudooceanicola marinus]SLN39302.1 hypothetical protein PSM7751_01781 [Pseudooceanicola marinus]